MQVKYTFFLIPVINLVASVCISKQDQPLVIAHRGSSGMFPEHTALAYREAVDQGADYIECDVEVTKDLKLVCSHEPWLSDIIDKSLYPQFADREHTYEVMDDDPDKNWNDKGTIKDWFIWDFTLEELKTMKRIQRLSYRDPTYDNQETFCTLQEYIDIAKDGNVGIYPEFKHVTATTKEFKSRAQDISIYDMILTVLEEKGYTEEDSKCWLQSFERTDLEYLQTHTKLKTLFLMGHNFNLWKDIVDWAIQYDVDAFGLVKDALVTITRDNHIDGINQFYVDDAHTAGKQIHVYAFRNEYMYLAWDYGQDPYTEYDFFLSMGIDGYFTDFARTARQFLIWKFQP